MILESPVPAALPTGTSSSSANSSSQNSLTVRPCEKQQEHNNHQEEQQQPQQHVESASLSTAVDQKTNVIPNTKNSPFLASQTSPGSNPGPGLRITSNTDRWLSKCSLLPSKLSNRIVRGVESYFYRLGYITGKYPFVFIMIGLLLTCITAGVKLKVKANIEREWIPKSLMNLNDVTNWVKGWEHRQESVVSDFPADETIVIVQDDNILTEKSINKLMDLHNTVWHLEVKNMNLLTYAQWGYLTMESLLQIWNFNETHIRNLTTEEILRDVNEYENKYKSVQHKMIADVKKNEVGLIIEAKVTRLVWKYLYTKDAWQWQKKFSELFHVNPTKFQELFFYTYYDFTGYGTGMDKDITYAITGYAIMTFYVLVSLGHCNCLEQKIGLTIAGMMCIAMGYGFTIGMGALLGVKTGKLNDILALMLLGIGIDDMFVILGTLRNLSPDIRSRPVPEQMGHVMKHAGVSITITTLSDVVAFGIGALSVFTGLNTFCIYNAIGILAIYFYQITFFASCISLDLRRVMDNRNACFCCFKHDDYKVNSCSQVDIMQSIFEKFATWILSKPITKIMVLFITAAFGSMNLYCVLQLEANDDWHRIMYPTTHVYYKYYTANEKYFPSVQVAIYCKNIDINANEEKLTNMSRNILTSHLIDNSTVKNWFTAFKQSANWKNASDHNKTENLYNSYTLETFLKSEAGKPYDAYVGRERTKYCKTVVRYSSFCAKIPSCSERPPQSVEDILRTQRCSEKNNNAFDSLCTCRKFYMMLCACKPPTCAPPNVTSFNLSCHTEKSTMCNYYQLNGRKVLSYNMYCFRNEIEIRAFKIAVQKIKHYDLSSKLKTIEDLQEKISPYFSQEECFAHARKYLQWSINNIIEKELIRNISLAFASVLIITLILITNVRTSIMVGSSVVLTMLNITGTLYLWGINIETTSCVILTISVGLVVDYSVHIGHTFMTVAGEKNHRMIVTVKEIGPPVFHGGFSTFIAVLPLCASITYPFQTFFKIFFLVVLFGLFHGLIYLPVLLSLVGPTAYPTATERGMTGKSPHPKKDDNCKQGITNNGMILDGEVEQSDLKENGSCFTKDISGSVASDDTKSHIQTLKWTHLPT